MASVVKRGTIEAEELVVIYDREGEHNSSRSDRNERPFGLSTLYSFGNGEVEPFTSVNSKKTSSRKRPQVLQSILLRLQKCFGVTCTVKHRNVVAYGCDKITF